MKFFRLIATGVLFLSFIMIGLGIYYYMQEQAFIKQCAPVVCKITDIEEQVPGNAYLTFTDLNGKVPPFKYLEKYDPFEDALEYRKNEIYEMYYYEKDPSQSKINSFFNIHPVSSPLLFMGVPLLTSLPVIILLTIKIRKDKKNE